MNKNRENTFGRKYLRTLARKTHVLKKFTHGRNDFLG